jgi:hypothetical protein
MEMVQLIKMCLNETYSRVRVHKHLSERLRFKNGVIKGDALSPLLFNFTLEYAIRMVQVNQDGFKLNGTHQILLYDDDHDDRDDDDNITGRKCTHYKEKTQTI